MTRVLIVEAAGLMWGSERALLDLADRLPPDQLAVCCPPGGPLLRELERRGVRTVPYLLGDLHRQPRWKRLAAAAGVLRACLEVRPGVIHLNQSGMYRTALPAATLLGLPLVAHIRLFEEVDYLDRQRNLTRLKGVIATSAAVEADLRSRPSLAGIAVHRLYDGYAIPPVTSGPRHPHRLVCAGRIEPMKGQALLIEALGLLAARGREVECLIAGEGEAGYVEALKARAGGLPVRWLGFVDDVGALLREAAVLAFPSWRETLGRVVLEAWSAGATPVVFAGSGGAAEIVTAAGAGVLYDAQTPEALAAALETALDLDDDRRARQAADGRAWMAAHCDPGVYAGAMQAIFTAAAA